MAAFAAAIKGVWIKRVLIFSLFGIAILGAVVFFLLSLNIKKESYQHIADTARSYFDKRLTEQKSNALTLAILLAQNEALKRALLDLDEERGHQILSSSLDVLKRYTFNKDIRAQVIAKDLTIFARSWDKEYSGMPIEGFRKDLSSFKITKPKVSIETGRLLTIKATAPLKTGYKIIGYVEIISFFESLAKELREEGIEMVALMRGRFLNVATLMRENPQLQGFVVSNTNYNDFVLRRLKKVDLAKLERDGLLYDGRYLYVAVPMRNSAGEDLGMFVLALDKKSREIFEKFQEKVSFFLSFNKSEFATIIDLWEHPQGNFRSVYDRSVLEFLSKNEDEEIKKEFESEAREILRGYGKEELIDIILQKYRRVPIQGEIK